VRLASTSPSTRAASTTADVVVAGGGMVGTAAALTLAKLAGLQDRRVLLLESSPYKEAATPATPATPARPSNRVSALSPATTALLHRLGAWQVMEGVRVQPVERMQVWESCSDAAIAFGGPGEPPLAHIVENDLTVKALTEVAQSCDNLEIRYGSKVSSYTLPSATSPSSPVVVRLEGGEEVEASLLVGADGVGSLVRRSLGGQLLAWQYDQMGIVATLDISTSSPNTTAWQRFLPSGPLALLPLSPSLSSLVWTVDRADAATLVSLPEQEFVEGVNYALRSAGGQQGPAMALTRGLSALLGAQASPSPPTVTGAHQRASFPLAFHHSPLYSGHRVALVGDSAHRVHPLAGQGANLGFGDVLELGEQVQAMVRDGAGLGHRDYLRRYETARLRHNLPTMLGVDAIQKLYSTALPPLVAARSLGLTLTAACDPLRRALQAHAAA